MTSFVYELLMAGLIALKEYIALHVLTCLIPAFLLAGAMVTFVSRETIIYYLGAAANKVRSFALASGGSFFVAACSCTVIPVSSGLYYAGAGVGVAFIVLWVAPATNILAIVYTGTLLGSKMVITRIITALLMAFIVGFVMNYAFRKEEVRRVSFYSLKKGVNVIGKKEALLLFLLALTLLLPNYLVAKSPYSRKVLVWAIGMTITFLYALKAIDRERIRRWFDETWWFVRMIFPLLLLGVFIVGIIGKVLPSSFVQKYLGGASVFSSWFATVIGQLMYFATMTEAPFVHKMLELGMGKGPSIALLLTGPGMSLPNILAIIKVFGLKKGLVYVFLIMCLGTFAGWFAGNYIF